MKLVSQSESITRLSKCGIAIWFEKLNILKNSLCFGRKLFKDINYPPQIWGASSSRSINNGSHFYLTVSNTASSLWVGTNGGHVYIYTVTVPQEKRSENEVVAVLAKEIKLRHKAPVMAIAVVDGRTKILPDPLEVQHARAKEPQGNNHSVVICSEEQLKVSNFCRIINEW